MFLGLDWQTWIALGAAAIAALMAFSAERSRKAAEAAAAKALTQAERANEIQADILKLSESTASHDRIRPVFEDMKTIAKVVGYDGNWKAADALLAQIAPDFDYALKELKGYYEEFRKKFYEAYGIQKQKESGLSRNQFAEIQPRFDELKVYFRQQVQALTEKFRPYLDS